MGYAEMRCPECGEKLSDWMESCDRCGHKFIIKDYDPQTDPDTRKSDKELWKYKYDTARYPDREYIDYYDRELINWMDFELTNKIKPIYDSDGKIKENLTFEEELEHYSIKKPTIPEFATCSKKRIKNPENTAFWLYFL